MIHFDKTTRETWKKENVDNISIFFYESGCAGTKIQVEKGKNPLCEEKITQENLIIYVKKNELSALENGRITRI